MPSELIIFIIIKTVPITVKIYPGGLENYFVWPMQEYLTSWNYLGRSTSSNVLDSYADTHSQVLQALSAEAYNIIASKHYGYVLQQVIQLQGGGFDRTFIKRDACI